TTWQLMPERNESLRGSRYTFKDYRSSLEKMSDFFDFLNEALVFKRYRDYPSSESHRENTAIAKRNIEIARTYIMAKLVAINLVEMLAILSGGDLPISSFLGPLPRIETLRERMEQFLPPTKGVEDLNQLVLVLLEKGLPLESSFDLKNSPLAAFVYKSLGDSGMAALAEKLKRSNPNSPLDCRNISQFPEHVVNDVAVACAKVCFDRSEFLLRLSRLDHPALKEI
ncbi:MAG: hypothetical protein AAB250_17230, partial [Bdellovibrionota bacterium]